MILDLAVRERARPYFADAVPAHDWQHVRRVERLAGGLAPADAELTVLRAAVFLHDIGREREARGEIDDHAAWGAVRARSILDDLDAPVDLTEHVAHCVRAHRYSTGPEPETLEACLLCDADNLDAMGAVGIGRCFAHGGVIGRPMHGTPPDVECGGQIAHIHSKLLSLRDRMYTDPGRELAERRHAFLERFIEQFTAELMGER